MLCSWVGTQMENQVCKLKHRSSFLVLGGDSECVHEHASRWGSGRLACFISETGSKIIEWVKKNLLSVWGEEIGNSYLEVYMSE